MAAAAMTLKNMAGRTSWESKNELKEATTGVLEEVRAWRGSGLSGSEQ